MAGEMLTVTDVALFPRVAEKAVYTMTQRSELSTA